MKFKDILKPGYLDSLLEPGCLDSLIPVFFNFILGNNKQSQSKQENPEPLFELICWDLVANPSIV